MPASKTKSRGGSGRRRSETSAIRSNPLKLDPTRTVTLRLALVRAVRRKFALLRGKIVKLVLTEDAFGLKQERRFQLNVERVEMPQIRKEHWQRFLAYAREVTTLAEESGVDPASLRGVQSEYDQTRVDAIPAEKLDYPILVSLDGYVLDGNHRWIKAYQLGREVKVLRLGLTKDDALAMMHAFPQAEFVENSFCPTGEGGGVDPSCSPSDGWKSRGVNPQKSPLHADALRRVDSATVGSQIPIRKIFDRVLGYDDYSFPTAIPGAKVTTKRVLISSLTATQTDMDAETVKFLTTHYNPERPMVYKVGKVFYVKDGHHTIAAEKMRGSSEVIVDIVNAKYRPGMSPDDLTTNAGRFQFHSSPDQVRLFQEWLRKQFADVLLGADDEELWREFAERGFRKGAGRAFDDVNKSRRWSPGQGDFYAGSRDQFLRSSFGQRESTDKLRLLASRSFTDLRNVTEDMATRMSRTLMDGLARGANPRDLADELAEDLDISQRRAETIAKTEIIRAHSEGQLDSMEKLGVEEVGVAVEFSTSKINSVDKKGRPVSPCVKCKHLEGVVLTIQEAHGIIPVHPECKCAWLPANVGEDQGGQKRSKAEILAAFAEADVDPPDLDDIRPKPLVEPTKNQWKTLWVDGGEEMPILQVDLSKFASRTIVLTPALRDFSRVWNAFCPTGPGGGVDPTCSPPKVGDSVTHEGESYEVTGGGQVSKRGPNKGRQPVVLKHKTTGELKISYADELHVSSKETAPSPIVKVSKAPIAKLPADEELIDEENNYIPIGLGRIDVSTKKDVSVYLLDKVSPSQRQEIIYISERRLADRHPGVKFSLQKVPLSKIKPSQQGEDRVNTSSQSSAADLKTGDLSRIAKADIAPIILTHKYEIGDGNHRFSAAKINGQSYIYALVME